MDKIPLEEIKTGKNGMSILYGVELSKCEEANAEKINDLIEWCRELDERVFKLEGK